jgi:hypothetical protein
MPYPLKMLCDDYDPLEMAIGADLDALAHLVGVTKRAKGECDAILRIRAIAWVVIQGPKCGAGIGLKVKGS